MFRDVNRLAESAQEHPQNSAMELFPDQVDVAKCKRIDYPSGYLVKENGAWHEVKGGRRSASFRQRKTSDPNQVVLYDAKRSLHLRIDGKGRCEAAMGVWGPQLKWKRFFQGKWVT